MAEELAPWLSQETPAASPPEPDNLAPWEKADKLPPGAKPAELVKKPEAETPTGPQREMPGAGAALFEGIGSGFREAGEGVKVMRGQQPEAPKQESPAAAPLEWSDIFAPIEKGLPKLAYGLGKSAPTLAGGLAGGLAGSAVGPVGAIAGGAAGAGGGAALQSIGPYFGDELRKTPNDPDGAWSRATQRAAASGVFSALGWGLFPAKIAEGPLKTIAFQAFGIQPGVAMGEQATQNVLQGKPATEDLPSAYAHGAVGTAIPMVGHAVLSAPFRERQSVADARANDPILSRLADPEDKSGASWAQRANKFYTAFKDDLNPVREAEKYLQEGQPLAKDDSAYIALRTSRGSQGRAMLFVDHETYDPISGKKTGEGLNNVINDPVVRGDLDSFRKYLLSRRSIELSGRGMDTGIPERDARDFVKANPQFQDPFNRWVKYNDNVLDYLIKSGIVGKDQAKLIRDANKDYVPFYRLMDDSGGGPFGAGTGKTWNPLQTIKGSERQIHDPIESAVKNTYLFISLADRNLAKQKLQKLVETSPRGAEVMEKIQQPPHPITVTPEETTRALTKQGLATEPTDPESFTIFRPNAYRPSPDTVAIFNDGKRSIYKMDPYLAAALDGLDREAVTGLTKLLAAPARFLRAGATLSPEFIARNPIRDQMSAFIFSTLGRGYVPFYDMALGVGQLFTKGEGYKNWLKSGGANSAMVSIDRNYVENLVSKMRDPTFMGSMKGVLKSPLELLRAMSETMENATRIGENMRQMKRGASLTEAGFASREITLDFQRIGSKMRAANAMVAFLNAQIEGVDRAVRSIGEQPLGFAAKVAAGITLPSMYLWWSQKDDPRVKEIPNWEKNMFWIYTTDNWQPISAQEAARAPASYTRLNKETGNMEINKGNIWRIPKPFELGVVFGSVPERIMEAYYAKNPQAFKDAYASMQNGDMGGTFAQLRQAFSSADPASFKKLGSSISQAFLPNFIPQAASPMIEQFSNRSLFTERPLVPGYLDKLIPTERATPYTTDTAKWVSNLIAKIPGIDNSIVSGMQSPIILENYIRAWTGGLGRHALDLSDGALRGAGLVPSKISPSQTYADKVGIKAFAVRFPEAGANSIQDFYEESDKRKQKKETATYLRKTGEPERAAELTQNNVLNAADVTRKALGAQFKMVRDTYRRMDMSAPEKRNFIDASYLQMIKIAQIGLDSFKKADEALKKRQGIQ